MRKPATDKRPGGSKGAPKKSAKATKKAAPKRVAAKASKPREMMVNSKSGEAAKPVLLAGGNPQIAKGYGDAPVQAYIAAMPGWKRDIGLRLDTLIERTVTGVRKAVKWNSPFYGIEDGVWFLSFHCYTNYVKVLSSAAPRCVLSRLARPSTRTCATSTSIRTTNSTTLSSPPG